METKEFTVVLEQDNCVGMGRWLFTSGTSLRGAHVQQKKNWFVGIKRSRKFEACLSCW